MNKHHRTQKGRGRKNSSHNNCSLRLQPSQTNNQLQSWSHLLAQIAIVTQKVRKVCQQSRSPTFRKKRQNSPAITPFAYHSESIGLCYDLQTLREGGAEQTPIRREKSCNTKCHELMAECSKLNQENCRLQKEKDDLQKRLFFQSKEKRELRWKLEKQRQSKGRNDKVNGRIQNFNCTLPDQLGLKLLFMDSRSSKMSNFSSMTAKKQSPLKERKNIMNQRVSFKSKTSRDEAKTDSLLLDVSNHDDPTQRNMFPLEKPLKTISLEKQLNELLQVSKFEKNTERKKKIRNRMKSIAHQIKLLRVE